jgi:CIC family chloride channel protein
VGYVQVRFGSSYFDVQLLNRGIDISDGRTGLFMYETEILEFAEVNFQTVKENDSVEKAVSLMSSTNQSELIVLDANDEYKGKINSLSLFNKSGSLLDSAVIDTNSIVIKHDASLQSAMEIAADFVGEIIPIINFDTKKAVAVITEGAIFQAYLSKQNQTVDVEKR